MASHFLRSKLLVPPLRPSLVERRQLFRQLDRGLACDLILVSAPAGYGKTTLLSAWTHFCGYPVAWLSLEEGENDPARFLAYLVAALQTIYPQIGAGLFPPHPESGEAPGGSSHLLEAQQVILLSRLEALENDFILVLDDYHVITTPVIHQFLAYLLDHRPPALHLAICARADPPLPLARLRANARLVELRLQELRFSDDEAAVFLNQIMGLGLDASSIAALAGRTEGWIAGLQMAAISMQGRDDLPGFIRAFTGSHRYVLDYLASEVLQRQPTYVQDFLMQTAILDRMCAALCDALLDDMQGATDAASLSGEDRPGSAQAILEHLETSNLFVVALDDRREWYRYHRLFADLLRRRLQQVDPALIPRLHRRASDWFQHNGLAPEAVEHALAAGDDALAAERIEATADLLLWGSEVVTLQRWLKHLPETVIQSRPYLDLIRAAVLTLAGQSADVVQASIQRLSKQGALSAEVAVLQAVLAVMQIDLALAERLSRQALERLPERSAYFRSTARWVLDACQVGVDDLRQRARRIEALVEQSRAANSPLYEVIALCELADVRFNQGRLAQAREIYQQALDRAKKTDGSPMPIAGQAWVGLGSVYEAENELEQAVACQQKGIELTRAWRLFTAVEGLNRLAVCQQAMGDEDSAQQALMDARRLAESSDLTDFDDRLVTLAQAQVDLRRGESETFWRYWSQRKEAGQASMIDQRMLKYERVTQGWAYLIDGRPQEVLATLDALLPAMEANDRVLLVIEIEILRALAWQALGDSAAARAALGHAVALSAPAGILRPFCDWGQALAPLLHGLGGSGQQASHADRLLAVIESKTPAVLGLPEQPGLVEPLSERELEVLRLLKSSMTVPEIAAELYVADSTVRSHIKSIYSKLGVHRRLDAVQRGEEMGLIGS